MTNQPYNLNRPPHLVTSQVIRRIEDYLYDANAKVSFGKEGHAIIQRLVDQYVNELSQEDVLSGGLALTNQELKQALEIIADIADRYDDGHDEINEHTPDAYIKLLEGYLGRISVLCVRAIRGEFPVDEY